MWHEHWCMSIYGCWGLHGIPSILHLLTISSCLPYFAEYSMAIQAHHFVLRGSLSLNIGLMLTQSCCWALLYLLRVLISQNLIFNQFDDFIAFDSRWTFRLRLYVKSAGCVFVVAAIIHVITLPIALSMVCIKSFLLCDGSDYLLRTILCVGFPQLVGFNVGNCSLPTMKRLSWCLSTYFSV